MRPAALSATLAIAAFGLIVWSDRAGPRGNARPDWYGGTSFFSPTGIRARLVRFEERWEKSLRASIDFTLPDRIETEGPPAPPPDIPIEQVCDVLAQSAAESELPLGFFARLIWFESSFRQRLVSRAGAQGVAQFMPKVAEERGLDDPFDPLTALPASARFLRDHYRYFGNWGLAAAAYNAGARRIEDWIARRGPMPDETRNYVRNITGHEPERWLEQEPIELKVHLPKLAPCEGVGGLSRHDEARTVPVFLTATIVKVLEEAKAAAERMRIARAAAAKARIARVAKARETARTNAKVETKTAAATAQLEAKAAAKPAATSAGAPAARTAATPDASSKRVAARATTAAKPAVNAAPAAKYAARPAPAAKPTKPVKLAEAKR